MGRPRRGGKQRGNSHGEKEHKTDRKITQAERAEDAQSTEPRGGGEGLGPTEQAPPQLLQEDAKLPVAAQSPRWRNCSWGTSWGQGKGQLANQHISSPLTMGEQGRKKQVGPGVQVCLVPHQLCVSLGGTRPLCPTGPDGTPNPSGQVRPSSAVMARGC